MKTFLAIAGLGILLHGLAFADTKALEKELNDLHLPPWRSEHKENFQKFFQYYAENQEISEDIGTIKWLGATLSLAENPPRAMVALRALSDWLIDHPELEKAGLKREKLLTEFVGFVSDTPDPLVAEPNFEQAYRYFTNPEGLGLQPGGALSFSEIAAQDKQMTTKLKTHEKQHHSLLQEAESWPDYLQQLGKLNETLFGRSAIRWTPSPREDRLKAFENNHWRKERERLRPEVKEQRPTDSVTNQELEIERQLRLRKLDDARDEIKARQKKIPGFSTEKEFIEWATLQHSEFLTASPYFDFAKLPEDQRNARMALFQSALKWAERPDTLQLHSPDSAEFAKEITKSQSGTDLFLRYVEAADYAGDRFRGLGLPAHLRLAFAHKIAKQSPPLQEDVIPRSRVDRHQAALIKGLGKKQQRDDLTLALRNADAAAGLPDYFTLQLVSDDASHSELFAQLKESADSFSEVEKDKPTAPGKTPKSRWGSWKTAGTIGGVTAMGTAALVAYRLSKRCRRELGTLAAPPAPLPPEADVQEDNSPSQDMETFNTTLEEFLDDLEPGQ